MSLFIDITDSQSKQHCNESFQGGFSLDSSGQTTFNSVWFWAIKLSLQLLAGSNEVNSKILTKYLVAIAPSLFSYQISKNERIVLLAERENGWMYSHLGGMLTGLCTMPDSRSLT